MSPAVLISDSSLRGREGFCMTMAFYFFQKRDVLLEKAALGKETNQKKFKFCSILAEKDIP